MTTLKERFDLAAERWEFYLHTSNGRADFPAIKAFIKEELNRLADEVENTQCIKEALTIIRTQADLL